ncbi:hypothetical protein GQ43DRAFT_19149 [Delitschia confertaspora ATCC 74209]|uniref:Uncharacterized protein n=1 Tax=Delitschia confertaspora ATCC 74209 TaxID=1513339 RepID=A0A9P4JM57_9PLEO|nr:hypothetical protein GQ43DRAFT_19149 [Delitschia confertaspora ATCC 74209]
MPIDTETKTTSSSELSSPNPLSPFAGTPISCCVVLTFTSGLFTSPRRPLRLKRVPPCAIRASVSIIPIRIA